MLSDPFRSIDDEAPREGGENQRHGGREGEKGAAPSSHRDPPDRQRREHESAERAADRRNPQGPTALSCEPARHELRCGHRTKQNGGESDQRRPRHPEYQCGGCKRQQSEAEGHQQGAGYDDRASGAAIEPTTEKGRHKGPDQRGRGRPEDSEQARGFEFLGDGLHEDTEGVQRRSGSDGLHGKRDADHAPTVEGFARRGAHEPFPRAVSEWCMID
jgi:hypothetical protein